MVLGGRSRPPGIHFRPPKDRDGLSLPPRRHRREGHLSWDPPRSRVLCATRYRAAWVTRSRPGVRRFRPALAVFRSLPSPMSFRSGFILSCAFRPSRVSRATARPAEPGTFPGLSSLFATQTGGVHTRGHPKPASFRPRRFSRPRRLPPPPIARVYFTPLPRPGFARQGLPLARSRTGSSPAVALLSFALAPCPQFYPMAPGNSARLQGFSPLASPLRTMVV